MFSDADFAGDTRTHHSRNDIVSKFSDGVISWMSKNEKV